MKMWKLGGAGLALLLACNAKGFAQGIPAVPGAPPPPPAAAAGAAQAGQAAGAANNIWSKLCKTDEQKAKCKERFCKCKLVQLMGAGLAPARALSGGLIGGCCPPVSPLDLLKPPDSAEGAAARIKQDTLEAKARREAVRFLATVDCRYWPEAQDALIKAMRADKNECVRMEAANSLIHGCCCTKPVIRALTIAVSCSNEDDNPIERSPRVRSAARAALEHCVSCYVETTRVEPAKIEEKPEVPVPPAGTPEVPKGTGANATTGPKLSASDLYYEKIKQIPKSRLIADAKRVLEKTSAATVSSDMPPPGSRSVFEVVSHVAHPDTMPTGAGPAAVTLPPGATLVEGPTDVMPEEAPKPTTGVKGLVGRLVPQPQPQAQTPTQPQPQPLPPSVQTPSKPTPLPAAPVTPTGMNSPFTTPTVAPAIEQQVVPVAPKPIVTQPVAPKPVFRPVPMTPAPVPTGEQSRGSHVGRPVAQSGSMTNGSAYTTVPQVTTQATRLPAPMPQPQQTVAPVQPKSKLVFQRAAYDVPTNAYQYPPVETPASSEQE